MIATSIIFAGILGLVIGSFLNVVVLRYGTGRTFGGRSMCMNCGTTLKWYELIPVLSYVFLRGRCGHCHTHISPRYAIGELLSAIIFAVSAWYVYPSLTLGTSPTLALISFFLIALFWALMLSIAAYDVRHTIIPDGILIVCAVIAVLWLIVRFMFLPDAPWLPPYEPLDLLAGLLTAIPFALLWLISKGTWMGFGDAKLIFVLGTFLGLNQSITFICIAFWIGAVFGLILIGTNALRKTKPFGAKTEVPFAPFLIGSAFLVMFLDIHLQSILEMWARVLY